MNEKDKLIDKIFALLKKNKIYTTDAIEALQSATVIILENNTKSKDLQMAASFFDDCKLQALNHLAQRGWE